MSICRTLHLCASTSRGLFAAPVASRRLGPLAAGPWLSPAHAPHSESGGMPPWTSRYGSSHRHHDKILEKIFGHPATLNIKIFEVTHLVESLGGKVEKVKHGNIRFELNGCHANFPGPIDRGTLHSKDELVKIRHFLERAGAAPAGTA